MMPVNIHELEAAINAARAEHPSRGHERALSTDVDALAGLYGEMIYRRHSVFDADSLDRKTRSILQRWLRSVPLAIDPAA